MKKLLSFTLIFCYSMLCIASTLKENVQVSKTKVVTYDHEVSNEHILSIHSSYGKIKVNTWNENYLAIEVEVKVEGSDEKAVNDRIDAISINFTTNENHTKAISKIPKVTSSWKLWGNNHQLSTEVNYIVHLPATNHLNVKHSYGEIHLDESFGDITVNFDYGKLSIGSLHGRSELNLDYVTKSNISYLNQARINANYSNFNIETANEIKLLSDYTQIQLGKIAQLSIASDYGKIEIDEVKNIAADIDYLTLNIKHLDGPAKINTDYGKVIIQKLGYTCGDVDINSEYTQISVGAFGDASFNFGIFADYTSFKTELDLIFKINEKNGISDKRYVGYFGNSNSSNQLSINASYGSIRFN